MSKKLSRSWFVAIIIVAGFALASCGGGDSSTSASLKKALADSEAESATQQEALDAAEMKLAEAIERAFKFSLSVYSDAISKYKTEASEYDEKNVDDYDAEADDDSAVDNLLKLAQKASTAAEAAEATAETIEQIAQAQMAVTEAAAAVDEAENEINQAKRTANSRPYVVALLNIVDDIAQTITDMGTKLTDDGVTVAVTRDGSVYKGAASDVGDGWYRADAAVEVVEGEEPTIIGGTATVYTDIEAALELFSLVHNGTRLGISSSDDGVLNLVTSNTVPVLADLNMYVMANAFPDSSDSSRGSTTITYVADTAEMTSDNPRKFDGTFDGVDGKYECTGESICSATANADGEFTAFVGTWTFTPDYLGADGVADADDEVGGDDLDEDSVAVGDPDYLSFGWWTRVNENKTVDFQNFADGNQPFTDTAGLTGTATYTGPAAGVYVMNRFNPNGTIDSIGQGVFRADAELTATFDGAVTANNKITGEVTNFMSDSADDSLANWNLELEATFEDMTTFNSESVVGGLGGFPVESGNWDGEFFGNPDPDDPDDPDAVVTDDYPNSVAGKFDAQSANVDVAGAFGAKR